MLDSKEIARRLRTAMDSATPPVKSKRIADVCDVSPQAVSGWRKTGRVAKGHWSKIARETGRPLEYFLGDKGDAPPLVLSQQEVRIILAMRAASPEYEYRPMVERRVAERRQSPQRGKAARVKKDRRVQADRRHNGQRRFSGSGDRPPDDKQH